MIEEIYVLVIAFFPRSHLDFIDPMGPYLRQARVAGAKIESCRRVDFPEAIQMLKVLELLNGVSNLDPQLSKEESVLRLKIRTRHPIRYRALPWLNALLKDYLFTPVNGNTGAYYFYLTKEDGLLKLECPQQLVAGDLVLDETTNDDDDFSYIQSMAPYLDRLFHFGDADQVYPEITAKLLLQFGE